MKIHWKNKRLVNPDYIDKKLRASLFQDGSLTFYLQQKCKGTVTVKPESESWQLPDRDEAILLNLDKLEKTFIREVWLRCDEQALIYARTVIPKKTLAGETGILANLGTRPLGEILFADKAAHRANVRYAKIPIDCNLYKRVTNIHSKNDEEIWARQSLFYIDDKPLLINEVFLPELSQCIRE